MLRVQTGQLSEDVALRGSQIAQKEERLKEALAWLEKSGAIMRGHFKFGQGTDERHGSIYINPRRLFSVPYAGRQLAQGLRDSIPSTILDQTEVVAGPSTCGIVVAHDLADFINTARPLKQGGDVPAEEVRTLFLDKGWSDVYAVHPSDEELLVDETGDTPRARRVLLVDDVHHRGRTFVACTEAIRIAGGQVIATAALIDRGMSALRQMVPSYYVGQTDPDQLFAPSQCPQCQRGEPITQL